MTPQRYLINRQESLSKKVLSQITPDTEVFGQLGHGYPGSFYRAYLRLRPTAKWIRVADEFQIYNHDPIATEKAIAVEARAVCVWAPARHLTTYTCKPNQRALVAMMARIHEVGGGIADIAENERKTS